ncbi:MAG: enoyl-CoA hydratase/isomerase family protein [Betaproteobacteria bacterium]
MTSAGDNICVEVAGGIAWLQINRPQARNALSRSTLLDLGKQCAAVSADTSVKAVVVTGEGAEAFAAGGDLKELSQLRAASDVEAFFDDAAGALDHIRRCPVPTVAALNGWALGGGAELALACDFRVAAAHAKIGYIQARLNISCGFGGGADLMGRLGYSRAMLHGLTAQPLAATQALVQGLVDVVAAADEPLQDCVLQFLQPVLKQTPLVIRAYKAMAIAEREGLPMAERRRIEREWFTRTWTHQDHWDAVDAMFRERKEKAS